MSARKFELAVPVNPTDHHLGPSHAPVTLVEYGDFECPNCKQAAPAVKLLLQRFTGRVRFIYRHFPLEEVHPHALQAALAAEVAAGQGKFWPMHDLLFDTQDKWVGLPDARAFYDSLAGSLGVNVAAYRQCVTSHKMVPLIRADYDRSVRAPLMCAETGRDEPCVGVNATPTFIIANHRLSGVISMRDMRRALDAALSGAGPAAVPAAPGTKK